MPNFNETIQCAVCGNEVAEELLIETADGLMVCDDCLESDFIQCDLCGKFHVKDDIVMVGNDFICEECLMENDDYQQCRHCEDWYHIDDMQFDTCNKNYVCEDCMDDMFVCEDCGEIESNDYGYYIESEGFMVCEDCIGNYEYCEYCENYYPASKTYTDDCNNTICDDCLSGDYYTTCDDCGRIIDTDYACYCDDGCFCEDCYPEHDDSLIQSYHSGHNDGIAFFSTEEEDIEKGLLFMGYELEVDGGRNRNDTAQEIYNSRGYDFLHFENDGSLDNGFEIISQPATLDYHMSVKEYHDKMTRICIANDFKSHDISTCGLHVHCSKNFFSDEEIAKLLFVFNNNWESMVTFSRRSESQLNRWASKYGESRADVEYLMELGKNQRGRYYAINLQNKNTLEFRFAKGTLNTNTFYATLQLISNLCHMVKAMSLIELQKVTFKDIVNFKQYDELNEYVQKMFK